MAITAVGQRLRACVCVCVCLCVCQWTNSTVIDFKQSAFGTCSFLYYSSGTCSVFQSSVSLPSPCVVFQHFGNVNTCKIHPDVTSCASPPQTLSRECVCVSVCARPKRLFLKYSVSDRQNDDLIWFDDFVIYLGFFVWAWAGFQIWWVCFFCVCVCALNKTIVHVRSRWGPTLADIQGL